MINNSVPIHLLLIIFVHVFLINKLYVLIIDCHYNKMTYVKNNLSIVRL